MNAQAMAGPIGAGGPGQADAVFVIAAAGAGGPSLAHALASLPAATTLAEEPAPLVDPGVHGDRRSGSGGPAGAIRVRAPWSKHPGTATLVPVDGAPRRALQIPHLDETFRDAFFVFVQRPAREAVAVAYRVWQQGWSVTHPDLDGWPGPPWSYALVPGWRELAGAQLEVVVAEQWARVTSIAAVDLRRVDPTRRLATSHEALLADPTAELRRLCEWIGLAAARVDQAAAVLRAELETEPAAEDTPELDAALSRTAAAEREAEALRTELG